MAQITFKGSPILTTGDLPEVDSKLHEFTLVAGDLSEVTQKAFGGKKKVLNIFPSMETGICQLSVKRFYKELAGRSDVAVLNISKDLPFSQQRFCQSEGLDGAISLSCFRSSFALDFGLEMADGPFKGLCSRCVIVADEQNKIIYVELVPEIASEPNYEKVLEVLGN